MAEQDRRGTGGGQTDSDVAQAGTTGGAGLAPGGIGASDTTDSASTGRTAGTGDGANTGGAATRRAADAGNDQGAREANA